MPQTAPPPKVSVIIPFKDAAETLPACLNALAAQNNAPPWELLAVNNNSRDDSVRCALDAAKNHAGLPFRLLEEETPGPGAARNRGAREAAGELLLFTDADCLPAPDWIADMWRHYRETPEIGAISGTILPYRPRGAVHTFTSLFTLPPHHSEKIHDRFTLITGGFQTANLAVPKPVFTEIGGFLPSLFPGEDHALCQAIYASGRKIRAVPDARVHHWHRNTFGKMLRQAFGYGRVHGYELRHLVPGAFIVLLPWLGGIHRIQPGIRVWLDFSQADKKALLLLALTGLDPRLSLLLALYLLRLALNARRRARELGIPLPGTLAAAMPFLMIAKSAALTLGRIRGSLAHRVLCV